MMMAASTNPAMGAEELEIDGSCREVRRVREGKRRDAHRHPDGSSGSNAKAYQAKTSPHMFVINPNGVLVYDGAIDDRPTPDPEDVPGAKNFVSTALTEGWRARQS